MCRPRRMRASGQEAKPGSCVAKRVIPVACRTLRRMAEWTFLTNHAHVLLCVARDPGMRLRDVADAVGITERAAQRIVADLVEAGHLERMREGRRNRYRVNSDVPLRHSMNRDHAVGELLQVFGVQGAPARTA